MRELLPLFAMCRYSLLEIAFCFMLRSALFLCRASLCDYREWRVGTVLEKSLADYCSFESSDFTIDPEVIFSADKFV